MICNGINGIEVTNAREEYKRKRAEEKIQVISENYRFYQRCSRVLSKNKKKNRHLLFVIDDLMRNCEREYEYLKEDYLI